MELPVDPHQPRAPSPRAVFERTDCARRLTFEQASRWGALAICIRNLAEIAVARRRKAAR